MRDGYLPQMAGGAGDPIQSNVFGLWVAKQPGGRGVPVVMTTGTKFCRWVGGDFTTTRADGTEPFSDNTLFGNTVDFVNTILGNGTPVIQGQSGVLAYLHYLACGQETVTGGSNDVQSLASTATGGTFGLIMNGYKTGVTLASTATAAAVATALNAAINQSGQSLPAAGFVATGGPLPTTPIVLTASGPGLANQPLPTITLDPASTLTGGTATITHTTTGAGVTHVATPNDAGGFWSAWYKALGASGSTKIQHQYNDCRIAALRTEGSSASKVVKLTPTVLSLDPGVISGPIDPTTGDDNTVPFIYTEGVGTWMIDGEEFEGHSSFAMEAQWGLQEWYGDDVTPFALVSLRATVLLQAITVLVDAQGLTRYNQLIYGTHSPAVGTKPIHALSPLGSYACQFNKKSPYTGLTSESAKYEVPSVKWDPGLAIAPNVLGGPVELPMAAEFRKAVGQPAFKVTTVTADPAYSA
jgi:hypothetical protein